MKSSVQIEGIVAGVSVLCLAVPGFVMYALFVYVALKQKKLRNQSYFILSANLGMFDMLSLLLQIFYAAPSSILATEWGGPTTNLVMGGLLNISWFATNPLILTLGVNRFICICHHDTFQSWFSITRTWVLSACAWGFTIIYSFPSFFSCCALYYNHNLYGWGWDTTKSGAVYLGYGELIMVLTTVSVVFVLNALVFRRIKKTQNRVSHSLTEQANAQRRKREVRLFFQFFVITLWLLVFDIPFIISGYVDITKWHGLTINLVLVINCSINGWSFYFINKTVRFEINRIFQKRSAQMERVNGSTQAVSLGYNFKTSSMQES